MANRNGAWGGGGCNGSRGNRSVVGWGGGGGNHIQNTR